jgi:hypothetical protein
MPFATLNGMPVLKANIHMPRAGLWTFDAQVDTSDTDPDVLAGSLTLATVDGKLSLTGTAFRSGSAFATGLVSAVVGANGMGALAAPASYRNATVAIVLSAILKTGGEKLNAKSDPRIVKAALSAWTVLEQPIGVCVDQLLQNTDALWRSAPDGTIWIGQDTFPQLTRGDAVIESYRPQQGDAWVCFESLDVYPGVTFEELAVEYVTHEITPGGMRTHLLGA